MMKKRIIAAALVLALASAAPAFALFIPSPEDILVWFLKRVSRGNQETMLANQVEELRRLVTQARTAQAQLTQVRDAAQGLVGSITDPMTDLAAAPAEFLDTARDWHSDYTGEAGRIVGSIRDLADTGESFSQSWRDVLQAADTVTEADIRNIYQTGADDVVAGFQRRRDAADRSLEYAGARADAGADLMQLRTAATGTMGRIGGLIDQDPNTGDPNRSDSALAEGDVLGSLAQLRTLIGIGRSQAAAATEAAADRFRGEELRREIEARRLADRAALEARWAQERAGLAAGAADRMESMYGGYRLPAVFSGN